MDGPVPPGSPRREASRCVAVISVCSSSPSSSRAPSPPAVRLLGAPPGRAGDLARSPELSASSQLADRRSLFVGDRFWGMGAQDGSYPATGFHTRGEMGGFWTPPIKLLDGIWFKAGDDLADRERYTSGWGYQRMDLGTHDGVADHPHRLRPRRAARRTGRAAARRRQGHDAAAGRRRALRADEGLPLGRDRARARRRTTSPDTASVDGQEPRLPRAGHPPGARAETHDYAAAGRLAT